MTNQEKRVLEIYTSLLIQFIRTNNNKALTDLRAFFYSMSFRGTYDPELLYQTCIDNIEILEKIPSQIEIVACTNVKSNILKISKTMFKPFYRKNITAMQQRQAEFSGTVITLYPKIKNIALFHEHLLTFYKEFAIMSKYLPIK